MVRDVTFKKLRNVLTELGVRETRRPEDRSR